MHDHKEGADAMMALSQDMIRFIIDRVQESDDLHPAAVMGAMPMALCLMARELHLPVEGLKETFNKSADVIFTKEMVPSWVN